MWVKLLGYYSQSQAFSQKIATFFSDETANGIVGSPYCIAFDWVGRNLYIGNVEASEISLVRVDGKLKYRMMVLGNTGEETGVSDPVSMALHPASGRYGH